MYVCLCRGITDTQIKEAVQQGASTMEDLGHILGVSQGCGSCANLANELMLQQIEETKLKLYFKAA